MKSDILIVGGAGHIGLPLGILFANKGKKVILYDKDLSNIKKINKSIMPFMEDGGAKILKKNKSRIFATNDKKLIKLSKIIIICIGTPVRNNKPDLNFFFKMFKEIRNELDPKKLLVIRSSIYPGTCKRIQSYLGPKFKNISYCPERVVQGKSIHELPKLPQIISGVNSNSIKKSKNLFRLICNKTIITSILEAELIKLFSNAWRYVSFSISNEFYMICQNLGIDFHTLRKNMISGYDRNKGIPTAGFAAGPCLYKDTAQLNAFLKNSFSLGKSATKINQNFPKFLYQKIKLRFGNNLKRKKIGILGMAFKSNIDDTRDSLSIELLKYLKKKKLDVIYSDDFAKLENNFNKKDLIRKSDIIIIGAPHKSYKNLKIPKKKFLVDSWGLFAK